MSSNGIGLQTARGSGTTGHIQRNIASRKNDNNEDRKSDHFKKRQLSKQQKLKRDKRLSSRIKRDETKAELKKHDLKRVVEVKCMELRETLEDDNEDELIIEKKVNELRDELLDVPGSDSIRERNHSEHLMIGNLKSNDNKNEKDKKEGSYNYKRRYTDFDEQYRGLKIRR